MDQGNGDLSADEERERTVRRVLPLTSPQRGMWFADRVSPDYSVNTAQYVDIRHAPGGLDIDVLMDCTYEVGRELETPYIRLTEIDGIPMQYVDVEYDQTIDLLDFSGYEDPLAAAMAWVQDEYRRPVGLIEDQLIVVAFLRISAGRTIWYQRAHHMIIDGFGALNTLRRILDRYNAARRGTVAEPGPALTLPEIVEYEDAYQRSSRREADRTYWLERVGGLPEGVTLARTKTPVPLSFDNVVAGGVLSTSVQARLERFARDMNTSPAVVLTAAFGAFLARMTGTDEIVLSLPVTGRVTAKIKNSGGMVSNILPIRLNASVDATVGELIDAAQLELTGALRHQRYRTEDIRREAGLGSGSVGFGPVINMVFFDAPLAIDGATLDYRILTSGILEDLLINLYQPGPTASLTIDLHGNPHLYTRDELVRHHRRFVTFLEDFLATADRRIADVDLLVAGEAEGIAALENGAYRAAPPAHYVLSEFERRAAQVPDAPALIYGDRVLSYREFAARAAVLARRLIEAGVGPDVAVGVSAPRSVEMMVAIYAVVSAGGQYVPIDTDAPADRASYILTTSGSRLLLVHARAMDVDAAAAAAAIGVPVWPVDADADVDLGSAPVDEAERGPVHAETALYTLFTSGSTGMPKGVVVSHAAVLNRLYWGLAELGMSTDDRVMQKTPYTFDCSVPELFAPLMAGACLVVLADEAHIDPLAVAAEIARTRTTLVHFVPSMLAVFLEVDDLDVLAGLDSVRIVSTTGEALPPAVAAEARRIWPAVGFYNLYGPTEAAIEITYERIGNPTGNEPTIPIGVPVWNSAALVLDRHLRRVPAGVPGELYLGGVQLARGYAARTDLSAERFVANPYGGPGERMYRTGDLVRRFADGRIDYLGRTDFQVKLRGQRIELGEIESVLLTEPNVRYAVVTVAAAPGGAEHLVAYLAGTGGVAVDLDRVKRKADESLPGYMVPTVWTVLDDIKLNSAGKLERTSLPAPDFTAEDHTHVAPESPAEIVLAGIIRDMLGVDRIGMRDNIFAMGADSLAAARLRARMHTAGYEIALADVFDARSVADLAAASAPLLEAKPALVPQKRGERVPLSYPQARLWFINRVDPEAPTYNMPGVVRLHTEVDEEALRLAIVDVLERHETLRTMYPMIEGDPVQLVLPISRAAEAVSFTALDVTAAELEPRARLVAGGGFDLVTELPVRFALLRVSDCDETDHTLVLVLHHIAGDGHSLRPLIADLITAYTARREGHGPSWARLPVQYADFTLWQRDVMGDPSDPGSRSGAELEFWRRELAEAPELLALPTDYPRPAAPSGRGGFVDEALDRETAAGIRGLAESCGVTPFTVLHTALAVVLGRLAGTGDVSIGTPVAGRDEPETADMVGMFVNTVVLRTGFRPATTVAEALAAAGRTRVRAMEHSQVAFEKVVDAVAGPRTMAHTPLFQVSLTLVDDYRGELAEWGVEFVDGRIETAKYDLAVGAILIAEDAGPRAGEIELEFNYSVDIFARSTIEDLARYVTRVLRAMVADRNRPLGTIDLLPPDELDRLTSPRRTAVPRTLRELVRGGAKRADPDTPAVVGASILARGEFAARAARIARALLAKGVGPGDVVALAIPRSALSVLATAAVIETGAAFVSIDVRDPVERRELMLTDSAAKIGITVAESRSESVGHPDLDWLVLGMPEHEAMIDGFSDEAVGDDELRRPIELDDAAYLIYTSGSTGLPKATLVPNRGLANLVAAEAEFLQLTPESRVLHVSSPTFDASILELTMAWGAGATLAVADLHTYAGRELAELIDAHGVTHMFLTPSVLATIDPGSVPTLRQVLGGGEANPPELVRRWVSEGFRYVNIYGPTETTVWTTVDVFSQPDDEVTIGRGLPGVETLVLDDGLRPVPAGVAGELYLSGDQVTLGYLGMPGLTATRFVANPFAGGRRMYRTGDRVQRRRDGRLDYLGRADHQLKIRGLRIEPGEVDEAMLAHAGVANSLTLGSPHPGGETVLVTYVTLAPGALAGAEELVEHARQLLPGHLVPQAVQVIGEFPRTRTGKIDRRRLPEFSFAPVREYIAPRTAREAQIAEVFAQFLGVDRVGVDAGFFELGGNSLAAVKLAGVLSGVTGHTIPVKALLEASSVEAIAAYVESSAVATEEPQLRPRPHPEIVPISEVQRGMWLLNRTDPDSPAYNIAFALRVTGRLDAAAVEAAAADLVERQATLRTYYPMVDGDPCQRVVPAAEAMAGLELELVEAQDGALEIVHGILRRGFDVTSAPPFRMALLRTGADEHIVVFVVHHISADGSSLRPLAHDFIAAAVSRTRGESPMLPPLRADYVDFTLWQSDRLAAVDARGDSERDRQLAYWRERLRGAPGQLRLPADRPRPVVPSFSGAAVEFSIPGVLVSRLEQLARSHDATLFDVVHAAYAVFLGRMAGVHDVVIGTAFAGRIEPALDHLVGMFVNSLPLRTELDPAEPFTDLVCRVHSDDMADMANADVAFEAVVESVGVRRSSAYNPVFQAMLLFQNFEMPVVEVPGLTITAVDEGLVAGQVDLQLSVFPTDPLRLGADDAGGPMRANFVYATDLFDAPTVERYAHRFVALLEAVTADPAGAVADLSVATAEERSGAAGDDGLLVSLPDLVEARAATNAELVAVSRGTSSITFGELWTMTTAMAAVIPDRDSALVTALMSLAPDLAAAGPEALSDVMADIRGADE